MAYEQKLPVRLALTDVEGLELYRLLTDERPLWVRVLHPLPISRSTIARLHVALRERNLRNKL
ncbi:hypothetical protein JOF56_010682 [Kibdelosporangium banguiense]|uniref:MarR family transcriptional regulator n=1 Tax=Kibdelosporangium banguiense TaxID=1365924 RepID=A0ABS4U0V8_9PSEU|nr:hypothetical protein [Kibdelosporangium banguiense]MBP2330297.1 hypothetical protein [Kibdelosporangium banguiense]